MERDAVRGDQPVVGGAKVGGAVPCPPRPERRTRLGLTRGPIMIGAPIGNVNELFPTRDSVMLPLCQIFITGQGVSNTEEGSEFFHPVLLEIEFWRIIAAFQ